MDQLKSGDTEDQSGRGEKDRLKSGDTENQSGTGEEDRLYEELELNIERLSKDTGNSPDIRRRSIKLAFPGTESLEAAILFTDGLADSQAMLDSLLRENVPPAHGVFGAADMLDYLTDSVIGEASVDRIGTFPELYEHLLSGDSILLLKGSAVALAVGTRKPKARGVEEPTVQAVVRGPREGFTEVLSWNTAMIRRKIKNPRLWFEKRTIGQVTKTEVVLAYIEGLVSLEVLTELREKLDKIDTDSILESNFIEERIVDRKLALFPTVFNSERPDVVAAQIMEGRVAILVDGTPFALVVPALFVQFFQSSEDYYQGPIFSSLIRMLRVLAFFLTLLTPSAYIAITTFHQELLPTTLLYNLASQREGVPFPAFVEALLMEITFEIIREASVRMPRTIGQSISIVGTLVIGQAAVQAGLVTAAMVIVVSITAISNFVMPAFNLGIAARITRFFLMGLAATFGLFGLFLGTIVIVVRLCSMQSFGVPYMSPMAPLNLSEQKDTLLRVPLSWMKRRPEEIQKRNLVRQK
ncbi:spore germination protein [Cohnella cellulosilytica]|uniref:Spore germination protein n=1 Tax=Cohnella cellulosilytica TaxID=986710 RepID=A0ABW2FIE4_9BACL